MPNLAVRLISFLNQNVGRCPRCMKSAFICALVSWPLYGAILVLQPQTLLAETAILLPFVLTVLWIAHAGTYGTRILRRLQVEYRSATLLRALGRHQSKATRRSFVWLLGTTAVLTATGSVWLPSVAFARASASTRMDGRPFSSSRRADDTPVRTVQQSGCPNGYPLDCGSTCCPPNSSCCFPGCCPSGYPHTCGSGCYRTLEGALNGGCSRGQIRVCGS